MLKKTLKSPLDSKDIKAVLPKGNQPWIFTGKTGAETEVPIICPPDAKSQFTGIGRDAGKESKQEEKGATEDEMVGWRHRLNGHECEQTQEMVKDGEAWHAAIHGITKSWTWLNNNK